MSEQRCAEALRLLEQGAHLIDVRSEEEHRRGAIQGAINIPLQTLPHAIRDMHPERPLIVYCASGGRSNMAKQYLQQMGFSTVHDLGSIHNIGLCH